jgi:hypothetical protein
LSIYKRSRRAAAAVVGVAAVVMSLGAATAMAEVHWSSTTQGMKVSGSLTVYKNGTEPKTCTLSSSSGSQLGPEAFFYAYNTTYLNFSCGTSMELNFMGEGVSESPGQYKLTLEATENLKSPWGGTWSQAAFGSVEPTFVNGSGSTSSKAVFSNTYLGHSNLAELTATGSLKVTTNSGGLLTLQP